MFKYLLLAGAVLNAVCLSAYDKIDFKSQITNPFFNKLSGVAALDGKILVADSKTNAVFLFDSDGKYLKKSFTSLNAPQGLAAGDDKIYVADTGNSRIVVLNGEGGFLWAFSGKGYLPGQLNSPVSVAYGPDKRVYVADSELSKIEVYNSDGIYLYGFPALRMGKTEKISPRRICADDSGYIYAADAANSVIVKYTASGKAVYEFPVAADSLVVDAYGTLFALSAAEGKVREISPQGDILGAFGTRGKNKTEFLKLSDIAIDSDGVLYLADEGNKKLTVINLETEHTSSRLARFRPAEFFNIKGPVKKYALKSDVFAVRPESQVVAHLPETKEVTNSDGSSKKTIFRYGAQKGQVESPLGMAVDKDGRLYIADTGNNRVQIFDQDNSYAGGFGDKAGFMAGGLKEGKFDEPSAIAINSKGVIYVADTGNKRVQAFNSDGMFLFAVGPQVGSVVLKKPIAVVTDKNRNVYILDSELKKVVVTDASGKFVRVWDDSCKFQEPIALAYDGRAYFYVLDRASSNIKILDEKGICVAGFFAKGEGERELQSPSNLVIEGNNLFVSDYGPGKILAFELSYTPGEPYDLQTLAGADHVALFWQAKPNDWLKEFAVYRASERGAEFEQIGTTAKAEYSDTSLTEPGTYYYSIAGVSSTGDTGELSTALGVYYKAAVKEVVSNDAGIATKNIAPMEIIPVELSYIFSANYKYYMSNPIGRISVKNNTDSAFSNVKVSFFLKDFMDFPSDTILAEIRPSSRTEVNLMATLNNRILNINEDTPIQCQLTMSYYQDGEEKNITLNQPVKVLSKNAIIWDKPERLANFITPRDTPVFALSRFVLNEKSKFADEAVYLNDNLLSAMMIWEGLGEIGLSYLADPVSPYSVKKSSKEFSIDTVQFPRNTLKLKSGDCDDLTALFASLMEASGLHTALLDYPTHIALMFDTGETDAKAAGLPEEYLIKRNGTWWAGLEPTMLGKNFYDSLKHAADLYRSHSAADVKAVEVRLAWAAFEPVTLPESETEINPDRAKFNSRVKVATGELLKVRQDYLTAYYTGVLKENPENTDAAVNLGILCAQNGEPVKATDYFNGILAKEPENGAALNNLGNLKYNASEYGEAVKFYSQAAKADPFDADILLNLARASMKLDKKEEAKAFVARAAKLDPETKSTGDRIIK